MTLILVLTGVLLHLMGQPIWCECGQWNPFAWDIWSSHNSQHLIDPYFFTHVLHGVLFYALLKLFWKAGNQRQHFYAAVILESLWEIAENSPYIINRYRAVTISLNYSGDSVLNSLMDIVACGMGFLIAAKLSVCWSVTVFAVTELLLLVTVRDGLLLNILMLVYPINSIKEWQTPPGSTEITPEAPPAAVSRDDV